MQNLKSKRIFGDALLLLTAAVWGGGFVVSKSSLESVTPLFVISFRFSIAFVAAFIVLFKRLKRINTQTLKYGVMTGTFMFLGFVLQTVGLNYTTTSKNAFLTAAHVMIVPFIYWIVSGRRPTPKNIIAAVTAIVGIGLLTLGDDLTIHMGDLLSLLSSLFFSMHIVTVSIAGEKLEPVDMTVVQLGTTALLSTVSAFIFEPVPKHIEADTAAGFLFLGLACTFIAYLFQNLGQKYAAPSHASILLCLESPLGCILSVIFAHEVLGFKTVLGCAVMLAAVVISEFSVKNTDTGELSSSVKDASRIHA